MRTTLVDRADFVYVADQEVSAGSGRAFQSADFDRLAAGQTSVRGAGRARVAAGPEGAGGASGADGSAATGRVAG